MGRNRSFEGRLNTLKSHNGYECKIGMIWGWLHTGPMSYKQFKAYMKIARTPSKINEDPEDIMG